jgi:hypothetical protein
MTTGVHVRPGRGATSPAREELRRQLLALVLVWYTLVVPAGPAGPARFEPDDEGSDGEVRGVTPAAAGSAKSADEELDWPEYIYP